MQTEEQVNREKESKLRKGTDELLRAEKDKPRHGKNTNLQKGTHGLLSKEER